MKVSVTLAACFGTVLLGFPSFAAEPARAFLDGLRARGFHDVAIDFLDKMATSPLAPAELKDSILYEKAATLIAASRLQRGAEGRSKYLNDAQLLLKTFVVSQPSHPKGNAARSQLGSLIFERARMKVEQSKQGNTKALLEEAQKLYDEAFEVFVSLQKVVSEELDQIPKVLDTKDRKQAQLAQRRTQLRADNLQTELLAAAIREETASTLPSGSARHTEYLSEAAALYDGIYKNYRGRLAGFYARLYQGRCNQRLGKLKDALGYYGELLDQPSESQGMFDLRTKTLRLAMECWLAPSQKKYVETIKQGSLWLASAPANKDRDADWLAIRYLLAKAYKMQADAVRKREPLDQRMLRMSIDAGLKQAKFVASETGEFQVLAQQLVTSLGGSAQAQAEITPQTFSGALTAGKEALDAIESAKRDVLDARASASNNGDPDAKAKLQAAEDKLLKTRSDAVAFFRLALQLADPETPQSDVNLVRYFLCYLYYLQQDHFQSALLGDFVSQRYPDSAGARSCAKLSLACYLAILKQSDDSDRQFAVRRLVGVANLTADTWPGSRDAEDALSTLVPHLVNAGNFDDAKQLAQRIPDTSPNRGEAELTVGQAMWGGSIRDQQKIRAWEQDGAPEGIDVAAKQADVESLQEEARQILAAGYGRLPDDPEVDAFTATSLLSLAQAYVSAKQPELAVGVLEHPDLGPLTLVDQNHSAVASPIFVEETYRTALQTYIGLLGTRGEAMIDKAKRVMVALQDSVKSDPAGQQRLLSVYVNLAQSVESQMKSASPDAKREMSQVFEAFLHQLASSSTDPGVLNWVAETFASIAAGFADGESDRGDVLNDDARQHYQNAITAFQNILDQSDVPPSTATQIRVRMANVMTKIQQYAQALELLKQVLAGNPSALNVQVEAARMLQQWGRQDPDKFSQAINGIGDKGTPSHVWGWGKIATATLSHRQFRNTFFEARHAIARCQLELANTKLGAEKTKLIASAARNVAMTKQLYPTLGGSEWTAKYNLLFKTIQAARGSKPR